LQLSMNGGAGNHKYLDEDRPREIVGVVADTRYYLGSQPRPMMYGSFRQHAWLYPGGDQRSHVWKRFEIRTASKPANLVPTLQKIAAEADKDQPLFDIKSMEESLSDSLSFQRFFARLFGVFAFLALFLAAVGIYGVFSYLVSRRTHEMGIRMALGASRSNVLKLIIGRGMRATVIGLVIGILASLALTRLIGRMLYNVKPTDPPTYIAVALILTAVALAACYVPARRATRVDPLTALRHE
jgi:ABC-type lipoprotein release transport system permease subunit